MLLLGITPITDTTPPDGAGCSEPGCGGAAREGEVGWMEDHGRRPEAGGRAAGFSAGVDALTSGGVAVRLRFDTNMAGIYRRKNLSQKRKSRAAASMAWASKSASGQPHLALTPAATWPWPADVVHQFDKGLGGVPGLNA